MELLLEIVKIIIWPLTLVIILLIFQYPINSFLQNAVKFKLGTLTINTSDEIANKVSSQVRKDVNSYVDDILKVIQYGEYLSRSQAFEKANLLVENYFKHGFGDEIRLDIKITAVSMHYSWPAFVSNISDWLSRQNNCKIKLSILLVDPSYINKLPFDKSPINWADETERRINDMDELVKNLTDSQKLRLDCSIKFFDGLPQYHGILINDDELFLGRTDWEFRVDKPPQLTVGQNRYRYFNRRTTEGEDRGSERVNLFLHWHQFYYQYNSTMVKDYINGIPQEI